MFRWAFALLGAGLAILGGLGYVWHLAGLNVNGDAAFIAVASIFPMMGTPYIIGIAFVCLGLQGVWICTCESLAKRFKR